ncbi:MAG: zinc-ribbon domain-containing protein [Myxococcota bacterium]|nr:zinc-ribbon domain-containing protein [Myxococcota bacterium]
MVITCPNCDAKYSIDQTQIKGRGARVTCKNCKHVFPVYREVPKEAEEVETPPAVEESVDDLDVYSLNFQQVGLKSWKVRIKLGLVYDFSDYKTLSKYIREGKVDTNDSLSHDGGKTWTPLNEIGDLERHFCEVYLLKKNQKDGSADQEEPDVPKKPAKMPKQELSAGLSDLASVLAEAEAEVSGRVSPAPYKPTPRKSTPKKKVSSKKKASAKKEAPPEKKNYTFVVLIALLVVSGGVFWQLSSQEEDRKETTAQIVEQKKTNKSAEQSRKEFQESLDEQKEKLKAERGIVEKKEEEEEKPVLLQPVIPEEILRQQKMKEQAAQGQPVAQEKGFQDYLRDADAAANQRRWVDAEKAYKKAYQLKPLANVQARWGRSLFEQNKFAQAKTILKSASAGSAEAYKWLGMISKEEGDDAQANAHFSKYLASNPPDAAVIRRRMNGE